VRVSAAAPLPPATNFRERFPNLKRLKIEFEGWHSRHAAVSLRNVEVGLPATLEKLELESILNATAYLEASLAGGACPRLTAVRFTNVDNVAGVMGAASKIREIYVEETLFRPTLNLDTLVTVCAPNLERLAVPRPAALGSCTTFPRLRHLFVEGDNADHRLPTKALVAGSPQLHRVEAPGIKEDAAFPSAEWLFTSEWFELRIDTMTRCAFERR